MKRIALVVLVSLSWPGHIGFADRGNPSPVAVAGVRVVDIRDGNGGVQRITSIPSSSLFRRHGGDGSSCSFTASLPGAASDGQPYVAGQLVQSKRWMFIEGLPMALGEAPPLEPTVNVGPLAAAVRHFTIFCDSLVHAIGIIDVPARDPLLDPRSQLTNLRNRLQLVRPALFSNPVVAKWGGLIARYQSWLAIGPAAWKSQRSNTALWRGWTMYLFARPISMDFIIDFTPARQHPSAPFHGVVSCVLRGTTPSGSAVAVPAMPALPPQSTPGVNGPCRWTPPGPGSVTVQARLSFAVTFWASGYTETLADYVWTSRPTVFSIGELAAVNTGA